MQGSGWRVDLLYIEDPTVALCLGTFGGSMGVGLSYERGTPVLLVSGSFHAGKRVTRADADLLYIETLHNVAKVLNPKPLTPNPRPWAACLWPHVPRDPPQRGQGPDRPRSYLRILVYLVIYDSG